MVAIRQEISKASMIDNEELFNRIGKVLHGIPEVDRWTAEIESETSTVAINFIAKKTFDFQFTDPYVVVRDSGHLKVASAEYLITLMSVPKGQGLNYAVQDQND